MIGDVGIQGALGFLVIGGIFLVDAGGCPQHAIELQAQQVGQRAALPDDGAAPPAGVDQGRVTRIELDLVAGGQAGHDVRVVGHDGRGKLINARE